MGYMQQIWHVSEDSEFIPKKGRNRHTLRSTVSRVSELPDSGGIS